METGPRLRVSADKLEKLGIKLGSPGYMVRGLSRQLLFGFWNSVALFAKWYKSMKPVK